MNTSSWPKEKKEWILKIDQLFCDLFGSDFVPYKYSKDKGIGVDESTIFIGMIAPNWPRAIHKLARVFSRDHRNTHGY